MEITATTSTTQPVKVEKYSLLTALRKKLLLGYKIVDGTVYSYERIHYKDSEWVCQGPATTEQTEKQLLLDLLDKYID